MIRGPLFQRASVVRSVSLSVGGSIDISSASFLPEAFFAYDPNWQNGSASVTFPPEFRETIKNMESGVAYGINPLPCSDGCTSIIKVRQLFFSMANRTYDDWHLHRALALMSLVKHRHMIMTLGSITAEM